MALVLVSSAPIYKEEVISKAFAVAVILLGTVLTLQTRPQFTAPVVASLGDFSDDDEEEEEEDADYDDDDDGDSDGDEDAVGDDDADADDGCLSGP